MRWSKRLLVAVALAAAWFTLFAPNGLGGPVGLIWVSGTSMEPGLHTGDLVIVYEHDDYSVGDVVAFEIPDGGTVIHRIIEATDDGYRFQGDNRDFADPWLLSHDEIIGSSALEVPHAGTVVAWLRRPFVLAGMVAALAVLWQLRPRAEPSPNEPRTTTTGKFGAWQHLRSLDVSARRSPSPSRTGPHHQLPRRGPRTFC